MDNSSTLSEEISASRPLVAISCMAYNHEPYIRQCLDGFVIQNTNFPFVAIVHDDASTDGTAAIIKEYAEKYPDIIKPIYETENQYSKKDGTLDKIMSQAIIDTKCKYIAVCEGDDYWVDPYKLQKQVMFMENHIDYSMCFCGVSVISENKTRSTQLFCDLETREYTGDEVLLNWTVPTCTVLYKAILVTNIPYDQRFYVGDNVLIATCAKYGRLYCLSDKMAVYRRNNSNWSSRQKDGYIMASNFLKHYIALLEYFPEFEVTLKKLITSYYAKLFLNRLKRRDIHAFAFLYNGVKWNLLFFLRCVATEIKKYNV